MPSIILRDVSKTFKTKTIDKSVLAGVNLEIPDRAFVILTGESGAGKSTLLNIIGGLELPSTGEVIVGERNIGKLSAKERTNFYRHEVGFVFQGFYLQPQLTLAENIALPGVFANVDKATSEARVAELAKMLGIEEVLTRKPEAVSGGQVERACIARALFMRPKIILADEPTNNLDPMNAQNVVEMFRAVWQQTGSTMIIASHDERMFKAADRVLRVEYGQVHEMAGEGTQPATSAGSLQNGEAAAERDGGVICAEIESRETDSGAMAGAETNEKVMGDTDETSTATEA